MENNRNAKIAPCCNLIRCIGLMALFFGLVVSGCSKEDIKPDEFYVKYAGNSSTIYIGGKLDIELTNENNQNITMQVSTRTPWEIVVGPVKKGFKASLKVSEAGNNYGKLTLQAQISVSKNGSSFALKEINNSDQPRTSLEIQYAIDY